MTLKELNALYKPDLVNTLFKCCGSSTWANALANYFPLYSEKEIIEKSDEVWYTCTEEDFLEAFTHHPKIGDIESLKKKFANTAAWASSEQSGAATAAQQTLEALAKGNDDYEKKFGYIFIVCATGKSANEMLEILLHRLPNNKQEEIKIAAAEQNKITHLRLLKLIEG